MRAIEDLKVDIINFIRCKPSYCDGYFTYSEKELDAVIDQVVLLADLQASQKIAELERRYDIETREVVEKEKSRIIRLIEARLDAVTNLPDLGDPRQSLKYSADEKFSDQLVELGKHLGLELLLCALGKDPLSASQPENVPDTMLASEDVLKKDWDNPAEDEAWKNLQSVDPWQNWNTYIKNVSPEQLQKDLEEAGLDFYKNVDFSEEFKEEYCEWKYIGYIDPLTLEDYRIQMTECGVEIEQSQGLENAKFCPYCGRLKKVAGEKESVNDSASS